MAKVPAVFLSTVAALALVSCGGSKNTPQKTPAPQAKQQKPNLGWQIDRPPTRNAYRASAPQLKGVTNQGQLMVEDTLSRPGRASIKRQTFHAPIFGDASLDGSNQKGAIYKISEHEYGNTDSNAIHVDLEIHVTDLGKSGLTMSVAGKNPNAGINLKLTELLNKPGASFASVNAWVQENMLKLGPAGLLALLYNNIQKETAERAAKDKLSGKNDSGLQAVARAKETSNNTDVLYNKHAGTKQNARYTARQIKLLAESGQIPLLTLEYLQSGAKELPGLALVVTQKATTKRADRQDFYTIIKADKNGNFIGVQQVGKQKVFKNFSLKVLAEGIKNGKLEDVQFIDLNSVTPDMIPQPPRRDPVGFDLAVREALASRGFKQDPNAPIAPEDALSSQTLGKLNKMRKAGSKMGTVTGTMDAGAKGRIPVALLFADDGNQFYNPADTVLLVVEQRGFAPTDKTGKKAVGTYRPYTNAQLSDTDCTVIVDYKRNKEGFYEPVTRRIIPDGGKVQAGYVR